MTVIPRWDLQNFPSVDLDLFKRNQFNVRDNVCEHSLFDKNSGRQKKHTKNV